MKNLSFKILKTVGVIFVVATAMSIWAYSGEIGRSAGKSALNATGNFIEKNRLEKNLQITSNELNKTLPSMVDENVRMDSTRTKDHQLIYSITLVKRNASEIDKALLVEQSKPLLIDQLCTSEKSRYLLKIGAEYVYEVKSNDEITLAYVAISEQDCY